MNEEELLLSVIEKYEKIKDWTENVRYSVISDEDAIELLNALLEFLNRIEPICDKYPETKTDITLKNMTTADILYGKMD